MTPILRRRARPALMAAIIATAVLTPHASAPLSFQPDLWVDGSNQQIAIEMGDFDEDGIPDVVSADNSGSVTLMLGRGDGWFDIAPGWPRSVPNNPADLVTGDFNHDTHLDVAVARRT